MTGIWTLKFLSAAFEKWNLKGLFFVGTFEENIRIPLFKNPSSLGGRAGGGGGGWMKEKNVPVQALYFVVYKSLCIYV